MPTTLATLVRHLWGAALLGFVLVCAAAPLRAQIGGQELEGKPVRRIDLVGLRDLDPKAVKALMETKEGQPFRGERLDEDIRKLINRDVFRFIPWVSAELTPDGTGVRVRLEASDVTARVVRVVFLGLVNFDRKDLTPVIQTAAGKQVSNFTLTLDRDAIVAFYRQKGHHFVEVDFIKRRETVGELIIFKITEGPEVSIRNVNFEGNESFTKDELLKAMPVVEEPGFLSSKEFVLDHVKKDVTALNRFYNDKGFLDAKVVLVDWRSTPDFEEVDLNIRVDEGEPFIVRSVTIEGVTLFDPEDFKRLMRIKVGGRYAHGFELRQDRNDIRDAYRDRGYTEAVVRDATTLDLEKPEVDLILRVQEGSLTRVGDIIIQGNVETRDNVIRREIELYTGEPLNLRKLKLAERRIQSLRYWDDTPGVRGSSVVTTQIPFSSHQVFKDAYLTLKDTSSSHIKDIVVILNEKDTGSLRFAAGVGSSSGFIGDITYRKDNFDPTDLPESFDDILDAFTGAGQFLTLSFQPGTIATRWRAAWGDPRIFDSPYGVVVDGFSNVFRREDWDEERLGASLRGTRRLGSDFSMAVTLRDELVEVTDIANDAPQIVFDFEGENRVTSLGLDLRLTRLDNFLDPTEGFIVNLLYEHGGLWGDIDYDKVQLSGEWFTPLWEDSAERVHVLQLRGSVGWSGERGDTRDVPVYERFFLGGSSSLRGFDFRGVGPRDNGDPIGGKAIWTAGIQYAYPLLGEQLRGVAFVDSGAVALDWGDSEIFNARVSVGAGVRLVVPFLGPRPIAIDFGIPVLKEDQDDTLLISFSFGSNF